MCVSNVEAAIRARHFSAPASLVKPLEIKPPKLLMLNRQTRSCRGKLRHMSVKEDGDCPTDLSPIQNSNGVLNDQQPNPAAISLSQITCRPTILNSFKTTTNSESKYFYPKKDSSYHNSKSSNYYNLSSFFSTAKTPWKTERSETTSSNHLDPSMMNSFSDVSLNNNKINNNNTNNCSRQNHRHSGFTNPANHSWNSGKGFKKSCQRDPALRISEEANSNCQQQPQLPWNNATITEQIPWWSSKKQEKTPHKKLCENPASNAPPKHRIKSSPLLRKDLMFLCFSLTLLLSTLFESSEAKICSSMNIKRDVRRFQNLTDCDIIEGHLIVASFEEDESFELTFPKLKEVTEYVILYEAQNIVKLDRLFPNLAVIRGNKLLSVRLYTSYLCIVHFIFEKSLGISLVFKGLLL